MYEIKTEKSNKGVKKRKTNDQIYKTIVSVKCLKMESVLWKNG